MPRIKNAIPLALGAMLLTPAPARAEDARERPGVAFFSALQELGPSTPEQIAERAGAETGEVAAADAALNDWKTCVMESVVRWTELKLGPGTVADGAFGRCVDHELAYRGHLQKLSQDGRVTVDLQLARTMVRNLEEAWRPRIVAAVLDQMLAAARAAAPPARGAASPPIPAAEAAKPPR